MENPICRCGQEMTFLMDNKSKVIFQCQNCGRLLLQSKDGSCPELYIPKAGLKEGHHELQLTARR